VYPVDLEKCGCDFVEADLTDAPFVCDSG
jgi:hypothetical protein